MKSCRLPLSINALFLNGTAARVSSNILWSVVSEVVGKGLLFLATIWLARTLKAENFGIFNFGLTLIMYFWLVEDLGTNMYGTRETAKDKLRRNEILNTILSIRLASGLVMFGIFISLMFFFSRSPVQKLVFLGFSFYLIFRAFYTEWFLRGLEKFKFIAICNITAYGVLLGMVYFFVKHENDVTRASFIWSLAFLVGGALFLFLTFYRQPGIQFNFVFSMKEWLCHLRESIHFVFAGGLSSLYQNLPIFLLGIFSTNYEVGIYSSAHRVVIAAIFVLSVFPMAIYPILSDFHKSNGDEFKRLFGISSVLMIFVSFLCSALIFKYSRKMVLLLFGQDYAGSVIVLKILAGFFFLRVIRELLVIAISSVGLQKFYSIAAIYSVVCMLISFFVIHYFLGVSYLISACTSILVTEFGMLLIMFQIWNRKIKTS